MSDAASREHTAVLDPVERVSEVVFGVLMALTFTGSLGVSAAGSGEIRTMMLADAMPEGFTSSAGDEGLEALRRGLVAGPARSAPCCSSSIALGG